MEGVAGIIPAGRKITFETLNLGVNPEPIKPYSPRQLAFAASVASQVKDIWTLFLRLKENPRAKLMEDEAIMDMAISGYYEAMPKGLLLKDLG